MVNYKGILIGLGVAGALVAGLFGTGVVKLNQESDEEASSDGEEAEDDDGPAARRDRKRRGRKGRKGRKGRRRKGRKSDLESLAYLGEVPLDEGTRDLVGVQTNEPGAYEGFMLANAAGGIRGIATTVREAALYGSDGKEVNRWKSDMPSKRRGWAISRLDSSGYLYAVVTDAAVIKLDWHSNVVWMAEGRFHHDLTVAHDGSIAALSERRVVVEGPEGAAQKVRLLDHGVVVFDSDGAEKERFWMHEIFKDDEAYKAGVLRAIRRRGGRVVAEGETDDHGGVIDVFHANSIIILPRDVEGLGKTGDLLISLRNMNTVAAIDRKTREVTWRWGHGELYKQHDATLTDDDNVVLFDNRHRAENSRAVVVDPRTNEILRTVGGTDATGKLMFFSRGRGLAQSLPNGNLMVVVSNEGRAFEVNEKDDILWEFWSPWKDANTRKPIRGTRLEGSIQDAVAKIVSGETPAPTVEPGSMRTFSVDLGGDPELENAADAERDDDEDADDSEVAKDEPNDIGAKDSEPKKADAQPSEDKPTGQDTPVPPTPQ